MKISLAFTLLFTCFTIMGHCETIKLSPHEQSVVYELSPHQDAIRIALANSLFGKYMSPKPEIGLTCTLCRTASHQVIDWIRQDLPPESIRSGVINICKALNILPGANTCQQFVDQYLDITLTIFKNRTWLSKVDVCGLFMGGTTDQNCRAINETMLSWDIHVDKNKPPPVNEPRLPDNIPKTKVIHLADIHLDLHYLEGSLADCDSYLCCRSNQTNENSNNTTSGLAGAGPWGDYRDCDQPYPAVEAILHDAASRHPDADFVIMTGDLTHHQIWAYSKQDNLAHFHSAIDLLRREFEDKIIYPVVGNHEPVPCNLFPTRDVSLQHPEHDISWVYKSLAYGFAPYLTPSALKTFRKSGYYTIVHQPGFRIISLNTNFCYTLNLWLLYSEQDPEGQLQWLSDRLFEAERDGEVVWIIGHVPPGGSDCWFHWGRKYNRIINRYEAIIKAQYFGHTHNDELKIFFDMDEEPPRATGALFVSSSVTPYSYRNPGYKVFYADGETDNNERKATWEILDHEAWIYNLTAANLGGASKKPVMFKEYSAKEMYGLASFRPVDLYELVERMAKDDETFQKYYRLLNMSYDEAKECSSDKCKLEVLCEIVKTDYSTRNCQRLEELMAEST